jgi:preprotein translocase subunit SecE
VFLRVGRQCVAEEIPLSFHEFSALLRRIVHPSKPHAIFLIVFVLVLVLFIIEIGGVIPYG